MYMYIAKLNFVEIEFMYSTNYLEKLLSVYFLINDLS